MGWRLIAMVASLVTLLPFATSSSHYVITVPNKILPHTTLPIAITHVGDDDSSNSQLAVTAVISGTSHQNEDKAKPQSFFSDGKVKVAVGSTEILPIKIGDWPDGNYNLNIKGSAGELNLNRVISVGYNGKKSSLFIQTDKGIYKAGQKVNFRVISVNGDLKPYINQDLHIYINDGNQNRIQQWDTVVPESGIFEGELQLSSQPVQGNWKIEASIKSANITGALNTVYFTVEKYVLPRFEISITPPAFITPDTIEFPVTISAKYTYGQPVKGNYLINVTERYCYRCSSTPVVFRGKIDGTATAIIKTGNLNLGKSLASGASLSVFGQVIEEFTGIQFNDTQHFSSYSQSQNLYISTPDSFKPLLPYTITVSLKSVDDKPVTTAEGEVGVVTFNFGTAFSVKNETLTFAKDGTAVVTITPPYDVSRIESTAYYKTLKGNGYTRIAESLSNKFIHIQTDIKNPTVGHSVDVKVHSSFQMKKYISYQITGRGQLLLAKTITLKEPTDKTSFTFKITREMAPTLAIAVFYITSCGEIVGDSFTISTDGAIQTPLSLKFDKNQTQPGDNFNINIHSSPGTTVALLAADQSVLLLSEGNDLTKPQIYNELNKYRMSDTYHPYSRAGYIARPSGATLDQIFSAIGVQLLTNGLYFKQQGCYYYQSLDADYASAHRTTVHKISTDHVEPTSVRSFFPETWLWTSVKTGENGKAVLETKVPDTITSWAISGFALNSKTGLGLTDHRYNVTVFKPFFLVVNLPYQVVRGETIAIQVLVFNYLSQDLEVFVTLQSEGQNNHYTVVDKNTTKIIDVASNGVQAVTFLIKPTKVGFIPLQFKATSPLAGDAIRQPLKVKPEGVTLYFNKPLLIDLRSQSTFKGTIDIDVSPNAVPDSTYIQFNGIGNIFGNVINNLNDLVRLPSGCGEQNMVNFVPNIVVLTYLTKIDRLTDNLRTQLFNHLRIGYQTELTYKRYDGSFSTFGNTDNAGSVWLTAFVVKSFEMAKPYITIDPNVILEAKKFIINSQLPDGTFKEKRDAVSDIQGGSNQTPLTLTAYVVIALLENSINSKLEDPNTIKRAILYLENNLNKADNPYSVAIVAYALELAKSVKADEAFNKLNSLSTKEGDLTYWRHTLPKRNESEIKYWWQNSVKPLDIEATGYALLTYVHKNEPAVNQLPIVAWLVRQQSSSGGYSSTQDTVIGIQALGQAAPNFVGPVGSTVKLSVSYGSSNADLTFSQQNELVEQQQEIVPNTLRSFNLKAYGNGIALAQVEWNYNVVINNTENTEFSQSYTVSLLKHNSKKVNSYVLEVCSTYLLNETSGMVIVQFNTLSGFIWSGLPNENSYVGPQRVETSNGNTVISLYYNNFPNHIPVCNHIVATETAEVSDRKCAYTSIFRYYNNDDRAESCYNLPTEE